MRHKLAFWLGALLMSYPVAANAFTFNWCNVATTATSVTTGSASNGANTANNGDYLLTVINVRNATDTASAPALSGWTCSAGLTSFNNLDGPNRVAICYKIASGETWPQTIAWGGTTVIAVNSTVCDWGGVNTSTPVDASGGGNNGVTANAIAAASISPSGSADLLIGVFMNEGGKQPYTVPGSMTLRSDNNAINSTDGEMLVGQEQLAASGATGTRTATMTGTDASEGFLLALNPAAAGAAHNLLLMGVGN